MGDIGATDVEVNMVDDLVGVAAVVLRWKTGVDQISAARTGEDRCGRREGGPGGCC